MYVCICMCIYMLCVFLNFLFVCFQVLFVDKLLPKDRVASKEYLANLVAEYKRSHANWFESGHIEPSLKPTSTTTTAAAAASAGAASAGGDAVFKSDSVAHTVDVPQQ